VPGDKGVADVIRGAEPPGGVVAVVTVGVVGAVGMVVGVGAVGVGVVGVGAVGVVVVGVEAPRQLMEVMPQ